MEKEVADAIADLKKRIERQESAHKHITPTETGGVDAKTGAKHGTVNFMPVAITALVLSAGIALLVSYKWNS
jgi:hypothetical protein